MNVLERAIKNFWDKQAQENGPGQKATNEDTWYRSLEIREIIKELRKERSFIDVLDVGCGNGFSTNEFANAFPLMHFDGIDFSEEMIKQARQRKAFGVQYYTADVTDMRDFSLRQYPSQYDIIISERCLINLVGDGKQEQAVLQLKSLVTSNGRIIIVENTLDGLIRLNRIRAKLGLPWIRTRWHNRYLDHDTFLPLLKEHFNHVECRNIGTPYYLLSRVIYAKYADMRGIEPDYNNWMNRFACKLPPISGWWASPNMMYVCSGKKS